MKRLLVQSMPKSKKDTKQLKKNISLIFKDLAIFLKTTLKHRQKNRTFLGNNLPIIGKSLHSGQTETAEQGSPQGGNQTVDDALTIAG